MQKLSIEARSRESADGFLAALADFRPRLVESDGHLLIEVELTHGDQAAVRVLNAIEQHIRDRGTSTARVNLNGCGYLVQVA